MKDLYPRLELKLSAPLAPSSLDEAIRRHCAELSLSLTPSLQATLEHLWQKVGNGWVQGMEA